MSANGSVTVAARISRRLKEALDILAGKLGMKLSKLGRIAVRLFLRQPLVSDINYELVRLSKKFPNGDKVLVGVALEEEEAERLKELAERYKRPISDLLTLALASVLNEPHDTILEESYRMGPMKAYKRAVEAGIVASEDGKPARNSSNKSSKRPNEGPGPPSTPSMETIAVLATIGAIAIAPAVIWAVAQITSPTSSQNFPSL